MTAAIKTLLACGHKTRFDYAPPKNGDVVWCSACAGYRMVVAGGKLRDKSKSWRCTDCGRKGHARNRGEGHYASTRHRVVWIEDGEIKETLSDHTIPILSRDESSIRHNEDSKAS